MSSVSIDIITRGITRIVILIGDYAIKMPNFLHDHHHFLVGCECNWKERKWTKSCKHSLDFYSKLSPTLFCSLFGLMSIQLRCKPLDRSLTDKEVAYFQDVTTDVKSDNFGYLNGLLVCFDYG